MAKLYAVKSILVFFLFLKLSGCLNLQAQQLGLANSNYAGAHSLYINPSAIADSRHAFYFNLFSIDAGATNNYFRYEAPVSLFRLFKDNLEFKEEYIKENLNGKPKLVMAGADFRGPSLMLRLSPKHSIAFTSRVRGGMQINNLSENIARLYKLQKGGAEAEDLVNQVSDNNTMNLNANVQAELGFSYARVIVDKEKHFVKGGFTLKKLSGGYSAHLVNEDTQFRLEKRPVAGTEESNYVLQINNIRAKYGYLPEEAFGNMEVADIIGMLTGRNSPGKGWGADMGFTYEYRPNIDKYRGVLGGKVIEDQRKNKYRYRVGIALMDVGGIHYNNASLAQGYDIDKQNKELNLADFDNAESTAEYAEILNRSLGVTEADKITSFRSGLPTALNVSFDYRIARVLYANATWIQGMRGKHAIGMRQNSLLALTPRLELRSLEASFPVALQNDYSVLTVGAMLKVGPLFVGSDNIGGAFNIGDPYGANVYIGMALSIAPPKIKRKGKDNGSDFKDISKKEPANIKPTGILDTDKDGVADANDSCPDIAGNVDLKGCPPAANSVPVSAKDFLASPATDSLRKTLVDSVYKAATDSLKVPATDSLRTPSADSLQAPAVKPLDKVQPASNTQPAPATKPENATDTKSEKQQEAIPTKKPDGAAAANTLSATSNKLDMNNTYKSLRL